MMTIVWAGLSLGAIYALVALTINLVYSSTGVFNFAQPQFLMLGVFIAYEGMTVFQLNFFVVVLIAAVIGAILGFLEDLFAIRPLKGNSGHSALVTTVGASIVFQGAALVIWGGAPRSVTFPFGSRSIDLFGGLILPVEIVTIVLAVLLAIILTLVTKYTRWGLAGRAATFDPSAAKLRGVNVGRVRTTAFVVAGAITTALGPVLASKVGINTHLGFDLIILGFAALAIGGFGSYFGALAGGMVVGFIEAFAGRYLGSAFPLIILFFALMIVLLAKPTGIFGARGVRNV